MIDYKGINQAALRQADRILPALFPEGRFQGRNFRCGDITGSPGQSLSVDTETGIWKDFGNEVPGRKISGSDLVSLLAARDGIPQGEAAKRIAEMVGVDPVAAGSPISPRRKHKPTKPPRPPRAAPKPPDKRVHSSLGEPNTVWEYRDEAGSLIGFVCRFDQPGGKKAVLPFTFGSDGWQWKQWTEPRPLYRLDELTARDKDPVILAEGEKATDAAQRFLPGMVATTWPGGGKAVGKVDFSPLRDRIVHLWPDNDQPGREAMDKAADLLLKVGAAEVRCVEIPPGVASGWDLADAESEGWTPEQTAKWLEKHSRLIEKEELPEDPRRLKFISAAELCKQMKPTAWLIDGFLIADTLGVLFGDSGSGKSFVAIDWGLNIASPQKGDWLGHQVREHGPVFYVAGEGFSGISKRVRAWGRKHNIQPEEMRFYSSSRPVPLLDEQAVDEMLATIDEMAAQNGKPKLVILDTLNRNFGPGDENSTADMTRFVAALDTVRIKYGCAVLVVHHTGHVDKTRGRGSVALKGALDWEFRLSVSEQTRILACQKMKDDEPPPPLHLEAEVVETGLVDEDLRPVTSLVFGRASEAPLKEKRSLTGAKRIAYQALESVLDSATGKAHLDDWRNVAYSRGISASEKPDAKQKAFVRAVRNLLDEGWIETLDDFYWPTTPKIEAQNTPDKPDIDTFSRTSPKKRGNEHVGHGRTSLKSHSTC